MSVVLWGGDRCSQQSQPKQWPSAIFCPVAMFVAGEDSGCLSERQGRASSYFTWAFCGQATR